MMRLVYKRLLLVIALLLAGCLFVGISYLFYDKVINNNETEVAVDNELSINFRNGSKIISNGDYSFSVTNSSDKDIYYRVFIKELKNFDSNITYSISSDDTNIGIKDKALKEDENTLTDDILIKAGTTQNITLTIKGNTLTTFTISVKKVDDVLEYFYATILKNNKIENGSDTKVLEEIAISNEGLIEDVDDEGITYYFRGNIENNYMTFANLTWRIVRINGDGTVKLVLDSLASETVNFHNDISTLDNYEELSIITALNSYYESNLKNYDDSIAQSKFCYETEKTSNDTESIYNSYTRLITNKIPTFNCLGEKYSSKIGLLTADEVAYAGANFSDENKSYYLYNESFQNVWWTSSLGTAKANDYYPFTVSKEGKLMKDTTGTLYRGLRPVINLDKKTIVTGSGTKDNPYMIKTEE